MAVIPATSAGAPWQLPCLDMDDEEGKFMTEAEAVKAGYRPAKERGAKKQ